MVKKVPRPVFADVVAAVRATPRTLPPPGFTDGGGYVTVDGRVFVPLEDAGPDQARWLARDAVGMIVDDCGFRCCPPFGWVDADGLRALARDAAPTVDPQAAGEDASVAVLVDGGGALLLVLSWPARWEPSA